MEFACDKCGTFLDSVDGAPAICRCNGAFHFPPVAVKDEAETEPPEPLFPDSPPKDPEPVADTSATFSPMPKMADETEKPKRRRSSRRK